MKISRLVLSGLMMLVSALAMAKGSGVAGVRELPATAPGAQTPLVVFLSGDGGWAALIAVSAPNCGSGDIRCWDGTL